MLTTEKQIENYFDKHKIYDLTRKYVRGVADLYP